MPGDLAKHRCLDAVVPSLVVFDLICSACFALVGNTTKGPGAR